MPDLAIAALAVWRILTIAVGSLLFALCIAAVPLLVLWMRRAR